MPESPSFLYNLDRRDRRDHLTLSEEQKETVRNLTLGVETVDETVRQMAVEDAITTLENGHPLNRLIEDADGNVTGYIACEDFVPREAYVKYLATTGGTGRNLLKEIPAFLEYAKAKGYVKINFHGWNDRLNRVLERYGFTRLRTDRMGDLAADFYEKELKPAKPTEQVERERREAFKQKYLNQLRQDYEATLATFSTTAKDNQKESPRKEKERVISQAFQTLSGRLAAVPEFEFGDIQKAVLKLKLARYFQTNETVDMSTLFDAIVETPKFIGTDKGSFHRLLEVHEEKTLEKIAEMRKRKAEQKDGEGSNPYEALFKTVSGNYYLARLLNMPHLEQESEYMAHCVGTSDSYINKMKRGDTEILSLRRIGSPGVKGRNDRIGGKDIPVMTIEYSPKRGTIEQMKKADDAFLTPDDPFYDDVIDALKQLPETTTDTGLVRRITRIAPSEVENLPVKDGHVLTERGEVSLADYDPEHDRLVVKVGRLEWTKDTSKQDATKILKLTQNIDCASEQVAYSMGEITGMTRVYLGPVNLKEIKEVLDRLPDSLEYIFTAFPEGKIRLSQLEIGGLEEAQLEEAMEKNGAGVSEYAKFMMKSKDFTVSKTRERLNLIQLSVADLGFPNGATTTEIFERAKALGLELCPPEVGPHYRLQYEDQPMGEWAIIGMKAISDSGGRPDVFRVAHDEDGLWLDDYWADPDLRWGAGSQFVFRRRKK